MPNTVVAAKSVHRSSLHRELPVWQRAYVWPFVVGVYPLAGYTAGHWLTADYQFLVWLLAVTVHALAFLACQWSTDVKAWMTCVRVSSIDKATLVLVVPQSHRGRSALCCITTLEVATINAFTGPLKHFAVDTQGRPSFEYQKKRYIFDSNKKHFRKLDYPVHEAFGEYKQRVRNAAVGLLSSTEQIEATTRKYGSNRFDIPMPTFRELFKEHAVAPFFVFQVFCVGLWLMDEYWYYSLFTLFMLFVFESTVVHQRIRSLTELRSMAAPPYDILVRRGAKWCTVKTDALLPGDIVSIVRGKPSDDSTVPCDILLLSGHCIVNEAMLSGESTPMMKESIELRENGDLLDIKATEDKQHVLFGGTKVLQHHGPESDVQTTDVIVVPDGGCIGYVLRTGFGTTQGKLVRTMVHSNDRASANNAESFLFVLFLLVFAIAAAYHVWTTGVAVGRKTSKLLLDCIIILTSVVYNGVGPPELPMELSLAVNQSLIALSRYAIFCTEPFRIPFAGKLDICCFDKTGTLTGDKLVVEGIAGIKCNPNQLAKATDLPAETTLVVATCHSLVQLEDGLIGDPMEKAILEAMGWTLQKEDEVAPAQKPGVTSIKVTTPHAKIIRRYPFSSALKRMSTIVRVDVDNSYFSAVRSTDLVTERSTPPKDTVRRYWISAKGAPEVLRDMFATVPDHYDHTYKHFAMNGSRVIALGWKWMTEAEMRADAEAKHKNHDHSTPLGKHGWHKEVSREKVEAQLQFAGFLVFHCPLKPDTASAIEELHQSMHRIVMITGDNPLTACHVARELTILRRSTLILDARADGLTWTTVDESTSIPFTEQELQSKRIPPAITKLLREHDICTTGRALDIISQSPYFRSHLLPRLFVYARTSPTQKEMALAAMKEVGYITMMVGDGTNDVGALKQAHIGVALLDGTAEDLAKAAKIMRERRLKDMRKKQIDMYKQWNMPVPVELQRTAGVNAEGNPVASHGGSSSVTGSTPASNASAQSVRHQQAGAMMNKMMESMEDMEEPPVLKFGDASVAAPFTSKLGTIHSICNIIRQGRCTLVTTIQMYKILALNSLITAFSLSALYLDGIKYGDTQVTLQGFLLAGCFLFLSWGKPIQKLSRQRPQPNIFNPYILLSVLGQFAVHIVALWFVVTETKKRLPPDWSAPDLDDESTKFAPNLLNTAVYLISLSMQVSTFLINYQGRPFREALTENKPLYLSLTSLLGIAVFSAAQVFPELNAWVELVPMEAEFSDILVKSILLDFGLAYGVEYVANFLFADNRPPRSLGLDDVQWEAMGRRTASAGSAMRPMLVDKDGELVIPAKTLVTMAASK